MSRLSEVETLRSPSFSSSAKSSASAHKFAYFLSNVTSAADPSATFKAASGKCLKADACLDPASDVWTLSGMAIMRDLLLIDFWSDPRRII